jgi:hypothetical protein
MTQPRDWTIVVCLNWRFYKRSSLSGLQWFRGRTADRGEEERGLIGELYETSEMKVGAFGFKIDLKPIVKRVWRYLHFRRTMKPYRGPPMTLGVAAAVQVRLIVGCLGRSDSPSTIPTSTSGDAV